MMRIRTMAQCGVPKVVLCDERGVILPTQTRTVLECGVDCINQLTVTFLIDGVNIVQELREEALRSKP